MTDIGSTLGRLADAQKAGWVDLEILPCGCVIGIEVKEGGSKDNPDDCGFGIVPCAWSCKFYRYSQDEAARQGMPGTFRLAESAKQKGSGDEH